MNTEIVIKDIIHISPDEDQDLWLRKYEDGRQFYADIPLINDKGMAVPEGLKRHGTLTASEEMSQQEKFRKKFLEFYPQFKRVIQEYINQLYVLAEVADQVQRNRTIAKMEAKSAKIRYIFLGLMGAGLSLYNPGIGIAVSVYTGAKIMKMAKHNKNKERKNMSSIEAEVKYLESTAIKLEGIIKEFLAIAESMTKGVNGVVLRGLAILKDIYSLVQDLKGLREQVKSECGGRLRQRVQELENMLVRLQEVYEIVQKGLILSEQCREQGGGWD